MSNRSRLLLLVSVAVLGGVLWFGSKALSPSAPPDEFAVSAPFTHGNLTVFLLYGPDSERSRPVLGLDEALARKCAVVHETGDVGELTVENTSEEDDLLLLSGDIVKGGRQDRVLQATMILPPKSGKVPVRSFCVEQSRWSKRGGEADTHFAENLAQIGGKELKKAVQLAGSQGEVWENVAVQQAALSRNVGTTVNSPASPTSLQLALENDKVQAEVAKYRDTILRKVGTPNGVIGFVTVVNGKVTGAEAFASHALFEKAWAKAVNAAAVEAVAEKTDRPFAGMTTDAVRGFLARAGNEARDPGPHNSGGQFGLFTFDVTEAAEASPDRTAAYRGLSNATRDRLPSRGGGTAVVITEVNNLVEEIPYRSQHPFNPFTQTDGQQVNPADPIHLNLNGAMQTRGRDGYRVGSSQQGQQNSVVPSKSAVVEYHEKGGGVIHKSFLPK